MRPIRSGTRLARLGLLALAVLAGPAAGLAQSLECTRLQAAIRASENDAGQGDGGGFERAARQQRHEIDRTQHYADQIGCGQQPGLFSDGPPPECADIEDRLQRMQDNLERIQARAPTVSPGDRAAQQAALLQRYNSTCVGLPSNPADLSRSHGFDGMDDRTSSDLRTAPLDPEDLSTVPLDGNIADDPQSQNRVAGNAICVRTCDGGYFPLAPRPSQDQISGLDELCKASCPNTEAKLYTMAPGGDLNSATSVDGAPYTDLPAAFKFEKTFTATCTCKPPNQSWVQALAGAERLLGNEDRHDITVTTSMSEQMSKPTAAAPDKAAAKGKAARSKPKQTVAIAVEPSVAIEGLRASQVPTATNDSAGIGGPVQASKTLKEGDGATIAVAGPNGVKKRIRLIVP